jgi:hypothetical protein
MCNNIKKIKWTLMKYHKNDNSISFTQLPHKFSYIVAILGHNHFESPNIGIYIQDLPELADQNNTVNSSSSENNRKNVQKNLS